jgi:hypothetical protein
VRVLFDQGTPAPLRTHLPDHLVSTAYELGWGSLKNGELLQQAEIAGFEVMVTTDQNLPYQQNLGSRTIAIVVLSTTSWPRIRAFAHHIANALVSIAPGSYIEIFLPRDC